MVQFIDVDGKRNSNRLGKVDKRTAQSVKLRVELLLNAKITNTPVDRDTATWLAGIGMDLADKLAAGGLTDRRASANLGDFIDDYIASRSDLKPLTVRAMRNIAARMIEHFGRTRSLRSITHADVQGWALALEQAGYAAASRGRWIRRASQFFAYAVKTKLMDENPARGVYCPPQHNPERKRFIDRETISRVMDVADREWRLILALARYGGLRVPCELEPLKLSDIDFEHGRLRVTSPKTARHAGKEERWIPLFPELLEHIEAAFDSAPEGEVYLVRHPCLRQSGTSVNLRKGLMLLLRKAGVSQWPRLFVNLRGSRETELAAQFPLSVVCYWLGNSSLRSIT